MIDLSCMDFVNRGCDIGNDRTHTWRSRHILIHTKPMCKMSGLVIPFVKQFGHFIFIHHVFIELSFFLPTFTGLELDFQEEFSRINYEIECAYI